MVQSTNRVLVLDVEKEVPGYPSLTATEDGRLFYKGRRMTTWTVSSGYEYTKLAHTPYSSRGKNFLVHRLVAAAWLENPEDLSDVNHKNGIKNHNCVDNLEWCTRAHNVHHAMRAGLHANPETAIVGWNPDTGAGWWFISQAEAARHGFTQANVSQAIHGRRAKCKGHYWEYA